MPKLKTYLDQLIAREKRAATRDFGLDFVIEWHSRRVAQLGSAIIGAQHGRVRHTNAKIDKFRNDKQMHEETVTYLKALAEGPASKDRQQAKE